MCVELVDGRIEDGDIPACLIGDVLPAIYNRNIVWRVFYIGEMGEIYPTWKEYHTKYGGVILPEIERIEERRAKIDIERFAKEIDRIGKEEREEEREFINRLDSLFPH